MTELQAAVKASHMLACVKGTDPLLDKILDEPYISISGRNGEALSLDCELTLTQPTVITNISTEKKITSTADLVFVNCPKIGDVNTSKTVFLIQPKKTGFIDSAAIIYMSDDADVFRNSTYHNTVEVHAPIIFLVETVIKENIIFVTENGERFRGKVYMDPKSGIWDLEHTDADVEVLTSEALKLMIEKRKERKTSKKAAKSKTKHRQVLVAQSVSKATLPVKPAHVRET